MSEIVLRVGMGEGVVTREPAVVLTAPGLGSCVALVLCEARLLVGAMAHIMLPSTTGVGGSPYRFADAAVPLLVRQFEQSGANLRRASVKMAGGAQMFRTAGSGVLNIGTRNLEAIVAILTGLGITVQAQDVGGNVGRTVTLEVRTGRTTVRIAGGEEREL